ncbi:MAG: hypothetical protein QXQ41_07820 [Candidatus Bathyarchaeia archaeon]
MENNPAEDTFLPQTLGEETQQTQETPERYSPPPGEAQETITSEEPTGLQPQEPSAGVEQPPEPMDLHGFLEMLKQRPDVVGYVLRDNKATNIELKDPTKLIEYAILSSASIDAGEELSQIFYIGNVKRIMVSGKNVQVISMTMGENKISVFMERDADPGEVLEKLENYKSQRFTAP